MIRHLPQNGLTLRIGVAGQDVGHDVGGLGRRDALARGLVAGERPDDLAVLVLDLEDRRGAASGRRRWRSRRTR